MPNQVEITSAVGITPPFSGTVCDYYGNNCYYIGSGTTFPITFTLPSQFNSAPTVNITLTDSIGCQLVQTLICNLIIPTPTASITNTPTTTPTPTPTPTITNTNTPTNSVTPTNTISQTPTNTLTQTPTITPTPTYTPSITPTNTETPTLTPTPTNTNTPTNTETPTTTPTNTETPTNTPTNTETPTNTPTNTETPTTTPTPTPTNTETPTSTPTNTPTNTPSSTMLNNYFVTQCIGTGIEVVDGNLLTNGVGTVFLGSDGTCWYSVGSPVTNPATITPLLQFNTEVNSGCTECYEQGCVYWEITDTGGGALIEFTPCCGESQTSPYQMSPDEIINICSNTIPFALTQSITLVNSGVCPGCTDYLLQEDGFYLLQEDGSKIIIT